MTALPEDDPNRLDDEPKPFLAHLEELRGTLIKIIVVLFIGILAAVPLNPTILDLLKSPLVPLVDNPDRFLRSLDVTGAFSSIVRISFWSGLLFSIPFIVYFAGEFILPGLTRREKVVVKAVSLCSLALFLFGVWMGYAITLKVALEVMLKLHTWLGIQAEWTLSSYVAFTTQLLIAFGLTFQLPIIIMVLGHMGIVDSRQLRDKRRHVFVGLLVLAMFLTPPDVFTQILMAGPLYILFEICIWLLWISERKKSIIPPNE